MLLVARTTAILIGLLLTVYLSFQISPWPSALLVRRNMNEEGIAVARALERHVPPGIIANLNVRYDRTDEDAYLDVFLPRDVETTGRPLAAIVWVHGGGWLAGSKDLIANYLKILASKGYATIGVNYSLAPAKTYPTPVRQLNAALAYISLNAERMNIDASRLILAGDSAGAQIAAQLALIISSPDYSKNVGIIPSIPRSNLDAVILYCGFYDGQNIRPGPSLRTLLWSNLRTMFWSYFGTKNYSNDARLEQFSVPRHITGGLPRIFISVGNRDQLAPQSYMFAEIAKAKGVQVDSLFFPESYSPSLRHEYQFDLDSDAGKLALQRSLEFLADERPRPVGEPSAQ